MYYILDILYIIYIYIYKYLNSKYEMGAKILHVMVCFMLVPKQKTDLIIHFR